MGCINELNHKITVFAAERCQDEDSNKSMKSQSAVSEDSVQPRTDDGVTISVSTKGVSEVCSSSGQRSTSAAAQNSKTSVMRPKEYDGKEPINSYLAHFRVCAEFSKWTEDEKRSWLQWSLKDRARQALWDEPNFTAMSFAELERALRSRLGSEHQRDIYKMESENRKRRHHESLSDLMQDVQVLGVVDGVRIRE